MSDNKPQNQNRPNIFLLKVEFKTQPSNGLGADTMWQTMGMGYDLHIALCTEYLLFSEIHATEKECPKLKAGLTCDKTNHALRKLYRIL
jgi:hypothetical protein